MTSTFAISAGSDREGPFRRRKYPLRLSRLIGWERGRSSAPSKEDGAMFRRMILGVVAIAAVMGAAGSAAAQVSVNIGINVPAPPHLVVVPATPVMYAPAVEANYFFYDAQSYVFPHLDPHMPRQCNTHRVV